MMQTALALVAADQGVSIVPACAINVRFGGVQLFRVQPDDVRAERVMVWPKNAHSAVLDSFLDLVASNSDEVLEKTRPAREFS